MSTVKKDAFPGMTRQHKSNLPIFLAHNPDIVKDIFDFCKTNITTLTVESLHSHIHEALIPKLTETIKKERNDSEYNSDKLKVAFCVRSLSIQTVYNWMIKLGFRYEPRKKSYYVDTHETPENVKYRAQFIRRYFEYEIRSFRWVSIPKSEALKMIEKGELEKELGYHYTQNGIDYIEYHVDDHVHFQDIGNNLPYGGNLSVRKPHDCKPLMILGQDECIFKQYLFSKGSWVLPDGTKQLLPKEEGQGVMLSSFCCHELGYGYPVLNYILKQVNKIHESS